MTLLNIRQRTGYLLLTLIVGHVVLISTQVTTRRGVPLFEAVVFGALAEVQRASTTVVGDVRNWWQDYLALRNVRAENEALKDQLAQLQVRLQQERGVAEQSRVLQTLLDLKSSIPLTTTGAAVIAGGASPEFRTMTIDKGTSDGFRPDMAVIAPAGVVGRIILPTSRASKVQLLIDRNAAAGALVERTRAQGVVVGTGTDRLRMDYVSASDEVNVGDAVVTSGIDGIYPKGFVIGQIESVQRGGGEYSTIVVRPAVSFSALESVLVVLTPAAVVNSEVPQDSGQDRE